MSQKEIKDMEHDLLGSLLEDIEDIGVNTLHNSAGSRMQSFSAPPNISQVSYKLDFDLLETSTFQSPDPEDLNIMQAFLKKQNNSTQVFYPEYHAPQGYRKMSCDPAFYNYQDNHQTTSDRFYDITPVYSPKQELFNNLQRVSEWAIDQHGSRIIQDIFQTQNDENKDLIFKALYKDALILITDRFGNYVFQKIFQKGLEIHKQLTLNMLWGSINILSIHSYGCRVIQKSLQYLKYNHKHQQNFINQILPYTITLIQNQNGNHVIQKCFQTFPHTIISKILPILQKDLLKLSYHMYGCRVIQKYLQNYPKQLKCKQILDILLQNCISLSQCQYGNYIMQYIVTKCIQQCKKIFPIFIQNIYKLSINKYASNVIQKIIQSLQIQASFNLLVVQYLINNPNNLIELTKHQYGNYVVQNKKYVLKNILKDNCMEISKSQYGRHVLLQIDKDKGKNK